MKVDMLQKCAALHAKVRVAGDDGFENGIYVIHVTFPFLCERMATPALDRTVLL